MALDDRALLEERGGEGLRGHFVHTDFHKGLTDGKMAEAIALLTGGAKTGRAGQAAATMPSRGAFELAGPQVGDGVRQRPASSKLLGQHGTGVAATQLQLTRRPATQSSMSLLQQRQSRYSPLPAGSSSSLFKDSFGGGGGGGAGAAGGGGGGGAKKPLPKAHEAVAMEGNMFTTNQGAHVLGQMKQREAQQRRKDEISLRYLRRGERRRAKKG